MTSTGTWVFGYGSLVWKADFPFETRLVGFLRGFQRRFWQASVDHRGTHEVPGRVVTLVPSEDPNEKVWGVAYKVKPGAEAETWEKLGIREITYGPVQKSTFYPKEQSEDSASRTDSQFVNGIPVFVYIAPCEGPLFLGPGCPKLAARQIITCKGPSGHNLEYFMNLVGFLRNECPPCSMDEHMSELETAVAGILSESETTHLG